MARLAMANSTTTSLAASSPRPYYVVVVLDGLGSSPELLLLRILLSVADRFPAERVLFAVLTAPAEVLAFKQQHGLSGQAGPLVIVADANPFAQLRGPDMALVDLSRVRDPDHLRRILSSIAEKSHDEDLMREIKQGKLFHSLSQLATIQTPPPSATHAGSNAPRVVERAPTARAHGPTAMTTIAHWVEKEATKRGRLWAVGSVVLGLIIGLASLFL